MDDLAIKASRLAHNLERLLAMRDCASRLFAGDILGSERFKRGECLLIPDFSNVYNKEAKDER